jgi:hypothetical protein
MPFGLGFFATAGAGAGAAGSFDLLETQVLTGSTSSVSFSNLTTSYAATYQHLQIRVALSTLADRNLIMRFNGDSGSNYSYHGLEGTGSSVGSFQLANASSMIAGVNPAGTNLASSGVIDILDPFEATKYPTMRSFWGANLAGASQRVMLLSGSWRNTTSLATITMQYNASDLLTGSRFSLYGLKAA